MLEKLRNIKPSKTVRRMGQAVLLLGLAILTLTAVTYKQKAVIKGLNIELKDDASQQHLIDKAYLKAILVKQFGSDLANVPVEFVALDDIESLYNKNVYVKTAEVYINKKGVLEILVEERQPILRLMDPEKSVYLDGEGISVPLATQYAARLPIVYLPDVAHKYLTPSKRKDLVLLANKIREDEFIRALTDQIEINAQDEYCIIPLLGDERIRIGTTENISDKLDRIKLFYKEKVAKGHWSQCTYIDVRFDGQIVCDKKKT